MRADRLLSELLLLQRGGRMTAPAMAERLEVSERTVLRDMEALGSAGVPVWAERGRHGGFALMPGWSTDLTGLTGPEARALLAAGSASTAGSLGLGPAFASGLRKLLSSMPASQRADVEASAGRVIVRGDRFIGDAEETPALGVVQQAVFGGRRLRFRYTRGRDRVTGERTVDPLGLVSAAGLWYLVALHRGEERLYRAARIAEPAVLDEPAHRPRTVDLDAVWTAHRDRFRESGRPVRVDVLAAPQTLRALLRQGGRLLDEKAESEPAESDDRIAATVEFAHPGRAHLALWSVSPSVLVRAPVELREELRLRAERVAASLAPEG